MCLCDEFQVSFPNKSIETLNQAFNLYDENFGNSRTKFASIINELFLSMAISTMKNYLNRAKSVSIYFDLTTMHNKRMLKFF